jgi:hypothetical protein
MTCRIDPKLAGVYVRLGEIYAIPEWSGYNLVQAKSLLQTVCNVLRCSVILCDCVIV